MTTHTPTPWELGSVTTVCLHTDEMIESPTDGFVAAGDDCDIEVKGTNAPANAAFIVRAVNAHDDLVKALEEIAAWAELPKTTVSRAAIGDKARAALRLAEEVKP
jgi:hypothetical protein